MIREAILHIPLSNYAYSISSNTVVFRLRAKKGDIKKVIFFFGDRSCRKTPVDFFPIEMEKVAYSNEFDYFSVKFDSPFTRICYYFSLFDKNGESLFYYGDQFEKKLTDIRSEYFQFDYNQDGDRAIVPSWLKDAIVYNIFPDSFATGRRNITNKALLIEKDGKVHKGLRGGTINGIRENLDYIISLGFNTIYLNPIFSAGEYHKYDLIDYYHVDPVFGSDEDFLSLVKECHKSGIRIIIDGVFNHIGWKSNIFQDCIKNGKKSKYWEWFNHLCDPIIIPDNYIDIPSYECFGYERMMPKLNLNNPECQEYFLQVGKYWVEKYDIDGWRLDVACEICDDFWRNFRKRIKSVKSECVLIGEVWETASHWLNGDMFDSTMNYDFRRYCERFFCSQNIDAKEFNGRVTEMLMRYREQIAYGQLNLLDSHDVSRFLSLCHGDKKSYILSLVFLFTFVGVPCLFYGDEMALEGENEDDYRQCFPWIKEKSELYYLVKELVQLRKNEKALRAGDFIESEMLENDVYSFERVLDGDKIKIILNRSNGTIRLPEGKILSQRSILNSLILPMGYAVIKV